MGRGMGEGTVRLVDSIMVSGGIAGYKFGIWQTRGNVVIASVLSNCK